MNTKMLIHKMSKVNAWSDGSTSKGMMPRRSKPQPKW